MNNVKWEMVRGDTLAFVVQIEGLEDNLSSAKFSCKADATDSNYVFQKTLADGITKQSTNKYRVRVAPEDTATVAPGTYAIDLQIGVGSDIATPILGTLKIKQDVSWEE